LVSVARCNLSSSIPRQLQITTGEGLEMTYSTRTRIAPAKPDTKPRPTTEQARKEAADRALEEGIRRFLAVSRLAVCQAA
jgi:hypothetical protein